MLIIGGVSANSEGTMKKLGILVGAILMGASGNLVAAPEAEVSSFVNGALESVGLPAVAPDPISSMVVGQWYGIGVQGATILDGVAPPEGSGFVHFTDPGPKDDPDDENEEPKFSTLSQRFDLDLDAQAAASEGRVTLLASFQVNLPANTYAKGRVRLLGLDSDGNIIQEETVAAFRPDHLATTWETIHLRDYQGLDLADGVVSGLLEIGFTADYPESSSPPKIAMVDDVKVFTHTVTSVVEVDDSQLASDGLLCVTGTIANDLVWALYDEGDNELVVYSGTSVVQTVAADEVERLQVYLGRGTDAFFVVDSVGARFAAAGVAEVYLHSGNDIAALSISLNDDQFSDISAILAILEEIRVLIEELSQRYEEIAQRTESDIMEGRVGPRTTDIANYGYLKQLEFKANWEENHQATIDTTLSGMNAQVRQLEIFLRGHEARMDLLLKDDEMTQYSSKLESIESEWEASLERLEKIWDDREFAVSDAGPQDDYDASFPGEGTGLTPERVENQMAQLERRLDHLDDALVKDEKKFEEVRDQRVHELEREFFTSLNDRIGEIRSGLGSLEAIATDIGDDVDGAVVRILDPVERVAETQVNTAIQAAMTQRLEEMFAGIGRLSHDVSAENNFGRVGTPVVQSRDTIDDIGEDVFEILADIEDLINGWSLPDDEVTSPIPLDCSDGHPVVDQMNGMAFGMGGIDVVIGTVANDLLSGGNGDVDLILGLAGNDVLRGAGGVDVMLGMGNDDFLHGGDDIDLMFGDAMALQGLFPNLVAGNDCLEGEDGIDFIFGEPGGDTLDGGMGMDLLFGGVGDDRLFGDGEIDVMVGWKGNDILLSDAEDNERWSNVMLGDGLVSILDSGKDELYATSGYEVTVEIDSCEVEYLFGDLMIGGDENDLLEGAEGVDVQLGGKGEDTLNGHDQVDLQFGGESSEVI